MTTEERLISTFGILLTMEDVALLFKRTPGSLRVTISNNTSELARRLRSAKVKRNGRRVVFRASDIAQIIDEV